MTKLRESLVSINRLLTYHSAVEATDKKAAEGRRAKSLHRDAVALSDQSTFLSQKINFLLDATLGLINLEQNQIIKIFSIAAVVLMPPTLVASIYGMNFDHMPELSWAYGYPMAIWSYDHVGDRCPTSGSSGAAGCRGSHCGEGAGMAGSLILLAEAILHQSDQRLDRLRACGPSASRRITVPGPAASIIRPMIEVPPTVLLVPSDAHGRLEHLGTLDELGRCARMQALAIANVTGRAASSSSSTGAARRTSASPDST